jgi:hypothetical protein
MYKTLNPIYNNHIVVERKGTSKSSLGQAKMTNAPRGKRNSLPSGLYFTTVDILRKYEISTREVEITLSVLKKNMDLFVIMRLIRLALVILKKSAYCSWCWTRMEKVVTDRSSSFVPQKTTFVPKKDLSKWRRSKTILC